MSVLSIQDGHATNSFLDISDHISRIFCGVIQ